MDHYDLCNTYQLSKRSENSSYAHAGHLSLKKAEIILCLLVLQSSLCQVTWFSNCFFHNYVKLWSILPKCTLLRFSTWSLHFWKLFPFGWAAKKLPGWGWRGMGDVSGPRRDSQSASRWKPSLAWGDLWKENQSLFGISVHSLLGWRCLCILDLFVCLVLASGQKSLRQGLKYLCWDFKKIKLLQ